MVEYKNEFIRIELLTESKVMKVTWQGHMPSDKYREGLERCLATAVQYKVSNWLTDARFLKSLDIDDQNWAMYTWLPRAYESGYYSKQAILLPFNLFAKIGANRMIFIAKKNTVKFTRFENQYDALEWLKSDAELSNAS